MVKRTRYPSSLLVGLAGILSLAACESMVGGSSPSTGNGRNNGVPSPRPAPQKVARAEAPREADMDMALAKEEGRPRAPAGATLTLGGAASGDEELADNAVEESRRGGAAAGEKAKPEDKPVKTWKKAKLVPNSTRLTVGDKEELPLEAMHVVVRIEGFRARVLLDCSYKNDRDRQLEGSFQLRLPDGAAPYFLAFGETVMAADDGNLMIERPAGGAMTLSSDEILQARAETWQAPKVARIVPKEKAALAYKQTVARRVDPALMEWSGAGVFNARVFPLLPGKMHRVVFAYDMDLLAVGKDRQWSIDLPRKLPQSRVELGVVGDTTAGLNLTPKAEWKAGAGMQHVRFDDLKGQSITLRMTNPGPSFLTGVEETLGDHFAVAFQPTLPDDKGAKAKGSARAVLMMDASLSANPERFNTQLAVLEALLNNNRPDLAEFAVLFFNVEAFWFKPGFTKNTPENVTALKTFAGNLALEGASDLGLALRTAAKPDWAKARLSGVDLFLMSDAAATWGESESWALSSAIEGVGPLFSYRTGLTGENSRTLEHLARESGGSVFSVVGEAEVKAASTAHRARPWTLAGMSLEGGTDLMLRGRPTTVFPGQRMVLAGRGRPKDGATLTLKLERGAETHDLAITLPKSVESQLAPRVYGEIATGRLEDLREAAEAEAKAYAIHYRVPGRTCSLLMLESEDDYKRYDIKPEAEAFIVKSSPAAKRFDEVMTALGSSLADPKAALLARLDKLERMPGMSFPRNDALRKAIAQLPAESLTFIAERLACKNRSWEGVPGSYEEALRTKSIDYDAVSAEAERRLKTHSVDDAIRALSTLVENRPGDGVLARDVGLTAMQWGKPGQAYHLFRRVAEARPFEPQSYRAMARCCEQAGRPDLAMVWYEIALNGKWDGRFGEFRKILGLDYLRFLRHVAGGKTKVAVPLFAKARLPEIEKEFNPGEVGLLITMTWNTDGTDIDLHVVEPTGEECYYSHPQTKIGGRMTQDVTRGYGPEMYTLGRPQPGAYKIRAKFYSSNRNRASCRTKCSVTIVRNWGKPDEQVQREVVKLVDGKQMRDVTTLTWK